MPQSWSSPADAASSRMRALSGATPARIDRGGVEELVDQPLQLLQRAVAAGAGERRRQVVDDHGGAAPLGLAALAGVVHDEGIDVRERPERGLREALGGERERLARQPFHVAVLAHVDHRVGVEARAQPGVEGEVAVRRRQVGVVVALLGVDVVAPRRLDRDDDVAEAHRRQREARFRRTEEGVGLRLAPALGDRRLHGLGQGGEEARVIGEPAAWPRPAVSRRRRRWWGLPGASPSARRRPWAGSPPGSRHRRGPP